MGDNVYLNADRSAVVEAGEPGKKWQIRRKEAQRLGLLPDGDPKPQARRSSAPEDTTREITTTDSGAPDKATPRRSAKK